MTGVLRIAVIGCGRMGAERADAAVRAGARVTAVCDADPAAADALAANHPGAAPLRAPGELPWDGVDAVFICTPPASHTAAVVEAAGHGVPFLVEKPVGLCVAECAPAAEALRRRPVVNAVGYMNRYRDSVARARALLSERPILGVAASWVCGEYAKPWWGRPELSGGPVNEQASHLVDLVRYLTGAQVTHVHAAGAGNAAAARTAAFTLQTDAGAPLSIFYSCQGREKAMQVQVFTPDAEIRLAGWDFHGVERGAPEPAPLAGDARSDVFRRETAAFLGTVAGRGDAAILCDYAEALRTQAVVDAMLRSLDSGRREPVAPALPPSRSASPTARG
ncbi:MAG TPA: Gfo/Idh/MocA family oxidoreductase [Longimicrobium sp.]|nr:Gfo/Idh/MocA family oxidoreductase [Longimicrobium sp.]